MTEPSFHRETCRLAKAWLDAGYDAATLLHDLARVQADILATVEDTEVRESTTAFLAGHLDDLVQASMDAIKNGRVVDDVTH